MNSVEQQHQKHVTNYLNNPKPVVSSTSGKATASLILGIVSFFGMCFTGIIGLILGILALSDISKSRGSMQGRGMAITGIVLSCLGFVWALILSVMIGMLLPAVQSARSAARSVQSENNVRQQVLAMLNYESVNRAFPQQDLNGLSWRVQILPFLEEHALYEQFHHDEPWDSPHNLQLLDHMPSCFECPNLALEPGFTVYQVPFTDLDSHPELADSGQVSLFDSSGEPLTFNQITDGSSNTVAIIEVNPEAAVEWTRPVDWNFDPDEVMQDLGGIGPRGFVIGRADGSVDLIRIEDISPDQFKAMITRGGGEGF